MVKRKKRAPLQVMFDTNADYELTKNNKNSISKVEENEDFPSGRLTIRLINSEHSPIVFFNNGSIQITYRSKSEFQVIKNLLPQLLVTRDDEPIKIFNERMIDSKLKRHLDHIDAEIRCVLLEIDNTQNLPVGMGYVFVKDEMGNNVHPFIPALKKQLLELYQQREKLFPTYSSVNKKDSLLTTNYK